MAMLKRFATVPIQTGSEQSRLAYVTLGEYLLNDHAESAGDERVEV